MSQSACPYPISQFILRLMEEYGFSRVEFIQALGYRNLERGLRRLESWMETGAGFQLILKQIAAAYPSSADELHKALADTETVKTQEFEAAWFERCRAEQDTFTPYIHADGERTVPNGITIFGLTGGHRRWTTIEMPQAILELPLEHQLAAVPELMRAYKRRNNGACPFFGRLVGFKLVRVVDYFQFDPDGMLIERIETPFRTGCVEVSFR
jgi:hypothetical protein